MFLADLTIYFVDTELAGFLITLHARPTVQPPKPPNHGSKLMSEKYTVLIIDDDQMIRSLAKKILDRAGFDTVLASTSAEAMVAIEGRPGLCDLVIADYTLDGLSGLELAEVIRSQTPALPVIISSGEHIEIDDIPAELQPNMHILQKPYRSQALVDMVEAAIADCRSDRILV